MRNLWLALVVVAVTAGCGTLDRRDTVYAKPGLTEAAFRADQNVCRQQAVGQAESKSWPTWGQTMNREAYLDCMRTLGYEVDTVSASPRW